MKKQSIIHRLPRPDLSGLAMTTKRMTNGALLTFVCKKRIVFSCARSFENISIARSKEATLDKKKNISHSIEEEAKRIRRELDNLPKRERERRVIRCSPGKAQKLAQLLPGVSIDICS